MKTVLTTVRIRWVTLQVEATYDDDEITDVQCYIIKRNGMNRIMVRASQKLINRYENEIYTAINERIKYENFQ